MMMMELVTMQMHKELEMKMQVEKKVLMGIMDQTKMKMQKKMVLQIMERKRMIIQKRMVVNQKKLNNQLMILYRNSGTAQVSTNHPTRRLGNIQE